MFEIIFGIIGSPIAAIAFGVILKVCD